LKNQQAWESEHNELTVLKRGREELYQKKHEIIRKENNAYSQIESYKATMQSKKHRFNQMIGKANHNALRSLETVRDYFRRKKSNGLGRRVLRTSHRLHQLP
jgi:translation initiation factor IF-2